MRHKRYISVLIFTLALMCCFTIAAYAFDLSAGMEGLARVRDYHSMRESSSDPDWRDGNADARPIAAGETLVLADIEGPGIIRSIWNTVAADERGYSRLLVIRMYWDEEEHPSVEVPLGDFFAIGHGIDEPFTSMPVRVSSDGRARNCYWPMPFRKSARITVTNEGRGHVHAFYYYINWDKVEALDEDIAYFHAQYRQEYPAVMGQNYLIADIEGRGHFVGTVLNVRQHQGSWFGEGDDFFFVDGEEEPSIKGTGTEDYFCDAWGFRKLDGPYYGIPVWGNYQPMSLISCYRWHIVDPIHFRKSLRFEIEHKGVILDEDNTMISGFDEREDDFSSVAFWYQHEPHKPFEPLPPAYDRLYFDPSELSEAEALIDQVEIDGGHVSIQEGQNWSGNGQIFWTSEEQGYSLSVPLQVEQSGQYHLLLVLTHSFDYGIFDIELNGRLLSRGVSLYHSAVTTRDHSLMLGNLDAGEHILTFRNKGTSSESGGYYFGFDAYMLQKQ